MSIRISVLLLVVLFLAIYAWKKDWFTSLCGNLLLMAFLEHPDMPRAILGIQGLNLWNLLYLNVALAWLVKRREEGLSWDMPRALRIAAYLYVGVIIWSFSRILINPSPYLDQSFGYTISGFLINPLKFLLPAFMLYDGCRSRRRVIMALSAILLAYFLISIQVTKAMGIRDFSGEELNKRGARVIVRSVGFHRVDVSMMLAGASWAVFAFSRLTGRTSYRVALLGAAGVIFLGQALTGGRTGYATWILIGLTLAVLRWRRLLLGIPIALALALAFLPGVRERMLMGFGGEQAGIVSERNDSEITSGRTEMWPHVIAKIKESPIIGYGRLAMIRTGLSYWLITELNEEFGHPHNAYLEALLDNGLLALVCFVPIYYMAGMRSLRLFLDRTDPFYEAVGGVALALLLALLFAAIGAQTLYPREGVVGMWAALAIAIRVWQERERVPVEQESWEFRHAVPA